MDYESNPFFFSSIEFIINPFSILSIILSFLKQNAMLSYIIGAFVSFICTFLVVVFTSKFKEVNLNMCLLISVVMAVFSWVGVILLLTILLIFFVKLPSR